MSVFNNLPPMTNREIQVLLISLTFQKMVFELDTKQFEIDERLNLFISKVDTFILNYNLKLRIDQLKQKKKEKLLLEPNASLQPNSTKNENGWITEIQVIGIIDRHKDEMYRMLTSLSHQNSFNPYSTANTANLNYQMHQNSVQIKSKDTISFPNDKLMDEYASQLQLEAEVSSIKKSLLEV